MDDPTKELPAQRQVPVPGERSISFNLTWVVPEHARALYCHREHTAHGPAHHRLQELI